MEDNIQSDNTSQITNEDELKQECVARLKILKLDSQIIGNFKNNDKIYVTQINKNVMEVTSYLEIKELVKSLEEKRKVKIYHIVSMEGEFKNVIYLLYTSVNKKEWELEKQDLKRGFTQAFILEETIKTGNLNIGIKIENGKIKEIVY